MNHGEPRAAAGRSPASEQRACRQQSEFPVTVDDRSLGESYGTRGREFRGRGRCSPSWSSRNSTGYANHERYPVQGYVKRSSQVSKMVYVKKEIKTQKDGMGSSKQPDESPALKFSVDLSQSSAKDINLSGDSFVSRECDDKGIKNGAMKDDASFSPSYQKVELSRVEDCDIAAISGSAGNSGSPGRDSPSLSSRNSSRYANHECSPVHGYVNKSSQVSNVEKGVQQEIKTQKDETSSTKQPDESTALISREFEGKNGATRFCDLADKMKDVSVSCQESVSSTSEQQVEISRVVEHYIVPKSDGAVNSSDESITSSFDIFREKVFTLKPNLLVLNREKKKAIKGFTGLVIRPGMVLLKNYLSINDQVMIVNKCRKLGLGEGGFYQPGYRDGALLHLKMMCLGKNWEPETSQYGETRLVDNALPPKIPVEFSQFVEKAIKDSQSLVATYSKNTKGEDGIPSMSPDICIVNFYTTTGRLGLHQDKDESDKSIRKGLPVVSFSIGDSAEFLYGDERDDEKAEKVELESGDVLIFGGKSRNIFHGVRSILKDTAPSALAQETSLRPGRLNLTFRQY